MDTAKISLSLCLTEHFSQVVLQSDTRIPGNKHAHRRRHRERAHQPELSAVLNRFMGFRGVFFCAAGSTPHFCGNNSQHHGGNLETQASHSPSTSSSGRITGLRKERTSGIVQSPLYMNLVVTARTGISARGNQQLCRDLHIVQISGDVPLSFLKTDPLARYPQNNICQRKCVCVWEGKLSLFFFFFFRKVPVFNEDQ